MKETTKLKLQIVRDISSAIAFFALLAMGLELYWGDDKGAGAIVLAMVVLIGVIEKNALEKDR